MIASSTLGSRRGDRFDLVSRFFWALASFVSSYGFRFGSNLVLTRLLDPHIFGIMVVVNAMRLGIELLTDVGIEQNIVRHKEGLEPAFFNTAWTMQIVRGSGLSILFLVLAPLLGGFYGIDSRIFLAVAFAPLLNSLHSTAIFALVKNLKVRERTLFEFKAELTGFVVSVSLAFMMRTVWAPVLGTLISIAVRSLLSYQLPHPRHRLWFDREIVREIIQFGRWIMVSSLVMFAASNLDRLVLGKIAPLALLGVYGLARTIADIPALMARRLTYQIVFPMLSAARARGDEMSVTQIRSVRLKLVLLSAVAIGVAAGSTDWAVRLLYDPRYAQAGWMLSLLMFSTWLSVLSNFNEGLLMGGGKPAYESGANIIRFCVLGVGVYVLYRSIGFPGAVCAMIAGELGRYLFVVFGQRRMQLSFLRQDIVATLAILGVTTLWVLGREVLGLGSPWDLLLAPR